MFNFHHRMLRVFINAQEKRHYPNTNSVLSKTDKSYPLINILTNHRQPRQASSNHPYYHQSCNQTKHVLLQLQTRTRTARDLHHQLYSSGFTRCNESLSRQKRSMKSLIAPVPSLSRGKNVAIARKRECLRDEDGSWE